LFGGIHNILQAYLEGTKTQYAYTVLRKAWIMTKKFEWKNWVHPKPRTPAF
jgi:hypothetical protein